MSTFIKLSAAAYRWILLMYPPDLRRVFGLALLELPAIALPRQLTRPALVRPVVSLLSTTTIFCSLVWALDHSLVLSAWSLSRTKT
jgi:hypothetical protein